MVETLVLSEKAEEQKGEVLVALNLVRVQERKQAAAQREPVILLDLLNGAKIETDIRKLGKSAFSRKTIN